MHAKNRNGFVRLFERKDMKHILVTYKNVQVGIRRCGYELPLEHYQEIAEGLKKGEDDGR